MFGIAVAVVAVSEASAGALTTAVGGGGVFLLPVSAIGTKSSIMSGVLVSSIGSSAASSSMPGTANAVMSGSRTVGFTLLPTEPSSCHGNVSTCLYWSMCSCHCGKIILTERENFKAPPTAVRNMSLLMDFVRKMPRCHFESPFCLTESPTKTITGQPNGHSVEL